MSMKLGITIRSEMIHPADFSGMLIYKLQLLIWFTFPGFSVGPAFPMCGHVFQVT